MFLKKSIDWLECKSKSQVVWVWGVLSQQISVICRKYLIHWRNDNYGENYPKCYKITHSMVWSAKFHICWLWASLGMTK